MESSNEASSRSLPPLVEGKVHGYLRLVIDEIVWSRRTPGDVTVLASWWGEIDSAQFRPADIKSGDNRSESEITETYSVRTNFELFEEYLTNCETVELVAISEKTHQVVGTARVSELQNLLNGKSYFQYVPITNDNGSRIGDIHVTMKLSQLQRNRKRSPTKIDSFERKQTENIVHDSARSFRTETVAPAKFAFPYENDIPMTIKAAKQSENIYRSILKERIFDPSNVQRKSTSGVNDKLVAQVVARAQRLRGAIMKEARDDDPLALSSISTTESPRSNGSAENENEATLYEYFLGKKMTRCEERKALETLRATSPTPSLIDLAQETIRGCPGRDFSSISGDRIPRTKTIEEVSQPETASSRSRELAPIDHVDSLRIAVESLTLSSAGYRRVRSSCMSRGDGVPVSVTYFVQYDAIFSGSKKSNNFSRKTINENRPVKLCSKKQVGQVVYFNHAAVYDLQKTYLRLEAPLRFKIFNRHLNQRTPTELGVGSMYVADAARAPSLSSTQRLAIVCKGIKIGELKVTVELGCDRVHFGKQFVEAVTSAKENIPVLDVSSTSSLGTPRYRTATGSENGKTVSSSVENRQDCSWTANNAGPVRQETGMRQQSSDQSGRGERAVRAEEPRRDEGEKVLLHGLIYVAEGKDLEASRSYLICRAFWREDRAASRLCEETNNPFYHFHQLVPLIHGADLLERTKDNCIVIEVYSRNSNGEDHLLGISKLPVHQLYVAYRDPQILPHLLRSKYPVISVDGWVVVADPVTGRPCGQLLALVALGTADQIALLEMTRGLRDSGVTPRTIRNLARNAGEITNDVSVRETRRLDGRSDGENYENLQVDPGRGLDDRNVKTQECQTEITTVRQFKPHGVEEEINENPQSQVLNAIVDRLAQALNVPKPSADQAAQTEIDFRSRNCDEKTGKVDDVERLNVDPSTNNSFSEDSDGSQRDNFHLSTEIYRSVGVGAEFDEAANQGPSTSYATADSMSVSGFDGRLPVAADRSSTNLPERDAMDLSPGKTYFDNKLSTVVSPRMPVSAGNEGGNSEASDVENSSFRAVVEIECALHLPKVEKPDEALEPCTYVTFQKARNNGDTQYGSYVVTNLCPFSCSPKWDWRCDTRLSNDLLDNEEKRLILKVWRLVDPDTSMRIDLERDVVIGFSAIDVSVLTVGFPVVSGWFHVMDFTGKCNGQIKVSVTPLDNIGSLGKTTCAANSTRPPLPDFDHSNFSSPYPADLLNTMGSVPINSARNNVDEAAISRTQVDNEPMLDLGLGDASMSFLSLSLKQKLTELDEIKKRLQSRLHDVTDTAFDDDFDNDFDMPLIDSEPQNVDNGNTDDPSNALHNIENWRIPREDQNIMNPKNSTERGTMTNGNRCHFVDADIQHATTNSNSASVDANFTDTGYSTSSNVQSSRNVSNGNRYSESEDNRFRSRLLSEENSNGIETVSNFAVSPNLLNGHYDSHRQPNTRNRTEVQNVRNYRSVDSEPLNFRGHVQDAENIQNSRSVHSKALDFRHHVADTGNVGVVEDPSNSDDRPIRGTRMHISHLLDKLTNQLTAVPPPTANQPMKRNIMDLITSLRRNNNNFPNDVKCNREVNVRTVPTQTEANHVSDSRISQLSNNSSESRQNALVDDLEREIDEIPAKSKRREKVSTAIREELAADESNNDCDELSAHLMTTNVRHMNLESILNPLIYQHLIPDVQSSTNGGADGNCRNSVAFGDTPEVEAVERLDTRYAENFNATINNGLSRLRNLVDAENSSRNSGRGTGNSENDEVFRMTPSGVSENIDGNIDVTVIHKPCNDELMASNSLDSTTTISMDNDMHAGTEIDDNSSLNSTDTSVSGVSRQAPEGGNPVEEAGASIAKRTDDSRDSSSES